MINTSIALYYEGAGSSIAQIIKILTYPEGYMVITNQSPFHPEDYLGGDQPGDKGFLEIDDYCLTIADTQTIILDNETEKLIFPESKSELAKKLESGRVSLLVGHFIVEPDVPLDIKELKGKKCTLKVDVHYRKSLSQTHTMVHFMSLILNKNMHSFWKKDDLLLDSMGNIHFDMLAIQSSKIYPDHAIDTYRIGKSLKKKGFDIQSLESENLELLSQKMTEELSSLIIKNQYSNINMTGNSLTLGSKRYFETEINHIPIKIPCGGTHVKKLGELPEAKLKLEYNKEEGLLKVSTIICHKN